MEEINEIFALDMINRTWADAGDVAASSYNMKLVVDKINELVSAVNKLADKVDKINNRERRLIDEG